MLNLRKYSIIIQEKSYPILNNKQYDAHTQHEIDKEQLRLIREDRDELMEQINALDRQEVNVIKMMKGGEK